MNHNSQTYPLISVVTVNYNQAAATCDMLESLFTSGYPALEVFVVDNASQKENPQVIKEKYPQIIFIQSAKNLGFAGGNNLALKQVQGEYIYLLNNDTVVPPAHLQHLIKSFDDEKIGVVCPKILLFDNPKIIMFAGYTQLTSCTLRNRTNGFGEEDKGQWDTPKESAYAHGAAMLLKREVLEKAGLMCEDFFLYYEEVDWSTRIRKADYTIRYAPQTYVLHKESLTTGRNSSLKSYYLNRNRVLFLLRNVRGKKRFVALLYQIFIAMPKAIFTSLFTGQFANVWAVKRAWCWSVANSLCGKYSS